MHLSRMPEREIPVPASAAADEPPADEIGRRLLWMTGAAALAIGAVALMLWGTRGGVTLLDLVTAFCA